MSKTAASSDLRPEAQPQYNTRLLRNHHTRPDPLRCTPCNRFHEPRRLLTPARTAARTARMTTPSLTERQHKALAELIERSRRREAEERDIAEQHTTTRRNIERAFSDAQESFESEYNARRKRLDDDYAAKRESIESTYERRRDELTSEADAVIEEVTDELDRAEQTATRKLQEAIWIAESVYEGNENLPQENYEQACRILQTQRNEMDDMRSRADEWLRKYGVKRLAAVDHHSEAPDTVTPAERDRVLDEARDHLQELATMRLPRVLAWPMLLVGGAALVIGAAVAVALLVGWGAALGGAQTSTTIIAAAVTAAVGTIGIVIARVAVNRRVRTVDRLLHDAIARARAYCDRVEQDAARIRDDHARQLVEQRDTDIAEARSTYEPLLESIARKRTRRLDQVTTRRDDKRTRLDEKFNTLIAEAEAEFTTSRDELEAWRIEQAKAIRDEHARESATEQREHETRWRAMADTWESSVRRCLDTLSEVDEAIRPFFPAWDDDAWQTWSPPRTFPPAVQIGAFDVDLADLPGGLPKDEDLYVPPSTHLPLPLLMEFPGGARRGNLLLQTEGEGRHAAVETLQAAMLRVLTAVPPGKARFTIIDPVGLGQSFAGFMHLADYDGAYVSDRIWTDSKHIEQRLADLTEHMENVIQKYLRNEFATIDEYNEQAGEIAEPYRFLIIADLPTNFTDAAAKRLASIINSGARCGVHVLMSMDMRQRLPSGLSQDDLERACLKLVHDEGRFVLDEEDMRQFPLRLDPAPPERLVTMLLRQIGTAALDSSRVEVPFSMVAPSEGDLWSLRTDTEFDVPIGRAGATKLQRMALGKGTSQHALIAGKTGSGKSTLLHTLITSTALWYSPHEVEFYLIDFKKGVEFKTYATHDLPHARVVAIESDREFGLSVLQKLDSELKRRGAVFRDLGVQDLRGYREAHHRRAAATNGEPGVPHDPMPRTLLIIDEFQEFFTEDDKLAQDASLLLDRLVRQGRAFGIHVLLGSQTLGGAYSLARSTLGQMAVRIALQCSEADSYLILSEDNAAARLLSRPGEAIYNDASGRLEGNSPFQVVWLPEQVREQHLQNIANAAASQGIERSEALIVFEGNIPADITGSYELRNLARGDARSAGPPSVWLGEAIAIKGPTAIPLRRLSGNNVLMVGQQDDFALAMHTAETLALAAQHRAPGGASGSSAVTIRILDGTPTDDPRSAYLPFIAEQFSGSLTADVQTLGWRDVETTISEIAAELQRRQDADITDAPPIYLFIHGLQRFRMLRRSESDFSFSMDEGDKPASADKQFATILREGPPHGVFAFVWCDTVNNLNRTLDRSMLREFVHRVLFQMSGNDSSELIDTPTAGKLGTKRAMYFSEEEGRVEKFRPWGLPDRSWVAEFAKRLQGASTSTSPHGTDAG